MTATPAAPTPVTTTLTSSSPLPDHPEAFRSAASTTIAVPCWSSWKTGMSSSARSRCSISKQRGAEMSSRLIPPKPGAIARTADDDLVDVLRREADRPGIDAGELLEQHRLAFHHRHRRLGPDVAEPEHGGAVGDDGDGVLLDRQVPRHVAVVGDGLADPGDARRVGHREVVARLDRHFRAHLDLAPEVEQKRAIAKCSTSTPSTERTASMMRSRWSASYASTVMSRTFMTARRGRGRSRRASRRCPRSPVPAARTSRGNRRGAPDRGAERGGEVAHIRITPSAASAAISSSS